MRENLEFGGSCLYSKSGLCSRLLYSDHLKTKISVIGYVNLSHEDELWSPLEIIIGTQGANHGYLAKIVSNNHSSYKEVLYTATPFNISDIFPVIIDQELSHSASNRAILVTGGSGFEGGLSLVGLTNLKWHHLISQKSFASMKPKIASATRIIYDQSAQSIHLGFYHQNQDDRDDNKYSATYINQKGMHNFQPDYLRIIDITAILLDHYVNIEKTLQYHQCYLRQY